MPIISRIINAWNAFRSQQQTYRHDGYNIGPGASSPPQRTRLRYFNEKSIISSIYTRVSIDVAGIAIRHIQLDEKNRYKNDMESKLNDCLMLEANLDQGPRAWRQDYVMTLFDSGVSVIVPVDKIVNDEDESDFEILTLRVGTVTNWYPKHVRVSLYNEATGVREEIVLEKRFVAIVENPFQAVMNEPNSTYQRLIRKLQLLDTVDELSSSGKLDLIIQLPYVIKSDAMKERAEKRREDIEFQLKGSQYGIAYTDGTEKVIQLNRPAENNLLKQIELLTAQLYSQLGLTPEVMNGTADEAAMLNYHNRTVEPVLDALVEAMTRAFLGVRGWKRKERIRYFRDPFKFVTVEKLAEIADKFSRNEILSANEIRSFMGIAPSDDPKADKLENSNMPKPDQAVSA